MKQFDLIVIGGGAAGLMACASAIRCGKRVLLLEKNNKLGVKILMSGGTRCNITHDCDRHGIVQAFGKQGRFLHSALASLPPNDVIALIESVGVATKSEPGGKIFPVSNRAIDVRDALVQLATDPTVTGQSRIATSMACIEIQKSEEIFTVKCDSDQFHSTSVLITTGGKSYPGCGTTGDGYGWAQSFGHRIVAPVAALTPITNRNLWTNELKGITFEDVAIEIHTSKSDNGKTKCLEKDRGGFLFTHFGFSGPTALNASREVSRSDSPSELVLQCDFQPDLNQEQLRDRFQNLLSAKPKHSINNVLSEMWPKRYVEHLLERLNIDSSTKAAEFGKAKMRALISQTKLAKFAIEGVYGFKKAEVTAGGVALDEIDSRSMESKLCSGLFFAGEVLDLDGPIGGYNFQAAFSTGWLAGMNC